MNYIGIDTSLSSTGLYILLEDGSEFIYNYRNKSKDSKWHKKLDFIVYRDYKFEALKDYSKNEINKITQYNKITDLIIQDIQKHCDIQNTKIITEGFSFSSKGQIIDLVCYAALVRNKLLELGYDLNIKSPSGLKKDTCITVYGEGENKKPACNTRGIAGGKFKKQEMLESLFDAKFKSKISQYLLEDKDVLLKMKSIPSPISDIVDALWLARTK
jgi:hypothetical protein